MDEALALAAVDFGGRSAAVVDTEVRSALVGDLQSTLVTDFLEDLQPGRALNVRVCVLYGRSTTRKIKVSGPLAQGHERRLPARLRLEGVLPSTKGVL